MSARFCWAESTPFSLARRTSCLVVLRQMLFMMSIACSMVVRSIILVMKRPSFASVLLQPSIVTRVSSP
eukprot:2587205-Rhodomonas_salina.1